MRSTAFLFILSVLLLLCLLQSLGVQAQSAATGDDEFDENAPNAYYSWFGMSPTNFDKGKLASAYKKLAKNYHPDKNPDPGAQKIFYKISKAFDVLNDDTKKALYDRHGVRGVDETAGGMRGGGFDEAHFARTVFSKMFEGFFDMDDLFGGGVRHSRGSNRQAELLVTLEDLFQGRTVHLEYTRMRKCSHCRGTGADDPNRVETCDKCQGSGAYMATQRLSIGVIQQVVTCDRCKGRGTTYKKACRQCQGQQLRQATETVEVKVPVGARDGDTQVFAGMAEESAKGEAGDLIVIFREKEHGRFERDGTHLYSTVHLTVREALLGFNRTLAHLDGSPLVLARSATVTQPGFVERLPGAGMPRREDPKERGDLFVKYELVLPKVISTEQRLLIEKAFTRPAGSNVDREEL